jgi:hypothetical protein
MSNSNLGNPVHRANWFDIAQRELVLSDDRFSFGIAANDLDVDRFFEQLQLFAEIKGWHTFEQLLSGWANQPSTRPDWASFLFTPPPAAPDEHLSTAVRALGTAIIRQIREGNSLVTGEQANSGIPFKVWVVQHSTQPAVLMALAALKFAYERGALPDPSLVRLRLSYLDGYVEPWRFQTCTSTGEFLERIVEPIEQLSPDASRLLAEVGAWEPLVQVFESMLCSQLTASSVAPFANGHLCVISHAAGVLDGGVTQRVNWLASHALAASGILYLNQRLDPAQAQELQLAPFPRQGSRRGESGLYVPSPDHHRKGSRTSRDYLDHAILVLSERVRRSSVFTASYEPQSAEASAAGIQDSNTRNQRTPFSTAQATIDLLLEATRGPAVVFHQDGTLLGYSPLWPLPIEKRASFHLEPSERALDDLIPPFLLTRVQRAVLEMSLQRTSGNRVKNEEQVIESACPTQFVEHISRFRLKRLQSKTPERLHLLEWLKSSDALCASGGEETKVPTRKSPNDWRQRPLGAELFRRIQSNFDHELHQRRTQATQILCLKKSLQRSLDELSTVRLELAEEIQRSEALETDLHRLMEVCPSYVIILDETLRIQSFSRPVSVQFGLRAADKGRFITDFSSVHQSIETVLAEALMGAPSLGMGQGASKHRKQCSNKNEDDDLAGQVATLLKRNTTEARPPGRWAAMHRFSGGKAKGFILAREVLPSPAEQAHLLTSSIQAQDRESIAPLVLSNTSLHTNWAHSCAQNFIATSGDSVALEHLCDFIQNAVHRLAPISQAIDPSAHLRGVQFRIEPDCAESVVISQTDLAGVLVLVSELCRMAPPALHTFSIFPNLADGGLRFEASVPWAQKHPSGSHSLAEAKKLLEGVGLSGFRIKEESQSTFIVGRLSWQPAAHKSGHHRKLTIVKPLSAILLCHDLEQRQSLSAALSRCGIVTACFSLYSSFISHIQRLGSDVDLVFASQHVLRTVSAWPSQEVRPGCAPNTWSQAIKKLVLIDDDPACAPAPHPSNCLDGSGSRQLQHHPEAVLKYPFSFHELARSVM